MDNCGCNGSSLNESLGMGMGMGSILGGGMNMNNMNVNSLNDNNNTMNVNSLNDNNNTMNANMNNNMNANSMDLSNLPPPKQVGNPLNNPMDVRNNMNGNNNGNNNNNNEALTTLLNQIKANKEDKPKEETKIKLILLGVVTAFGVASALSWHEAAKYYISRSIKFSNGSPMYYLYYAVGTTLLTIIMFMQSKKWLN
jgi:hypothetical protein